MSNLDKLIEKYCPNGIKYQPVSEMCSTFSGGFIKKTKQDDSYTYPVYNGGSLPTGYYSEFNTEANSIAISGRGSIGFVNWVETKFWAGNSCHVVNSKNKMKLNNKFLYYFLKDNQDALYKLRNTGSIPALNLAPILDFKIPVPHIEIQNEIIRILDQFLELGVELEAELETRKTQYIYYRNNLLDFSQDECPHEFITEVFDIKGGYTPSKSNSKYWENGQIPWFRLDDIQTNGRILKTSIQHVSASAVKGSGLFPANSIIMSTSATLGEHALVEVPFLANQRFTILVVREKYSKKLLPKFIFYYSYILAEYCKLHTLKSGFAGVNMAEFRKFKFPIPSIETQIKIIKILDNFSELTSSISSGLPAEIGARRKQYEYYRNKLLTFKELETL